MRTRKQRAADAKLGVVAVIALLFLIGLGWAVLPPESLTVPQAQRQTDSAAQHHAKAQAQVSRAVDTRSRPAERDGGTAPKESQTDPDGTKRTDVIQALSAVATTFFTGVLTWFAYQQIRISAAQVKIARVQASIARGALRETAIAAAATKDSAVAARDSLILSQRPWILVDVSIGGPLRYDDNGMNITLDLVLTNTGQTPAFQVMPHIVPYLRTQARFDDRTEQMKLAEEVKSRRPGRFGYTIFPKRDVSVSWTVTIPHVEIGAAHAEFERAITYVTPFIVGTVSYVFTLSDRAHQTGIIYQLVRLNPPNPRITLAIDTAAGEVPREMLALSESSLGGPYID